MPDPDDIFMLGWMNRFAQVKSCCLVCRNGQEKKRRNQIETQNTGIQYTVVAHCFFILEGDAVPLLFMSMFESVVENREILTFQDQLRLFSGLGTSRSAHTGSCHDITALKTTTTTPCYNTLWLHHNIQNKRHKHKVCDR